MHALGSTVEKWVERLASFVTDFGGRSWFTRRPSSPQERLHIDWHMAWQSQFEAIHHAPVLRRELGF